MIILDKKSYELLFYLIKLEEPETVMAISKTLGQSRRKIYYHLDKINEALPKEVNQIISYPRIGVVLDQDQKEACKDLLADIDDYSYVMSVEERMQLITAFIAVSMERVTIDKLMQLTEVSRNTVLNDLNDIRRHLEIEQFQIKLVATKTCGYFLESHPLSKFQFFYKLLSDIDNQANQNFVKLFKQKLRTFIAVENYFPQVVLDDVGKYLMHSQSQLGKKINSQDVQFMIRSFPYILLCYRNMFLTDLEKESVHQDFDLIYKRKEYTLANGLAQYLEDSYQFKLDYNEIGIIAMLLLSFRKDRDSHLESHDYDDMRLTLVTFLDVLTSRYGLQFNHKKLLLDQLLTHCKALIYRKNYGIFSSNPLTEHIKEKYAALFEMTQSAVSILEKAWSIKLNDDDISYITVHIGGEVRRSHCQEQKRTIILVCDDGIGLQKLLLQQCKQYLPNHDIEAVFTTEQFHSVRDLITSDLVITTTDALDSPIPTLLVHSILTDNDKIRLIRFVRQKGQVSDNDISTAIEKCIRPYIKDEGDLYVLKSQIEKIINQELLLDIYR